MDRKERWKEKQRQQVKEKMDKSVRAAQIYDELTRQNEEIASGKQYHSSSRRTVSREKIMDRLKSCAYYPLVYAGMILAILAVLTVLFGLVHFSWVKNNISFKKPAFEEYVQAEIVPINSDFTDGTVSKSSINLPKFNENYAKIKSDKLGMAEISVFYRGNLEANKIGAVQENGDSYFGFPGYVSVYSYHTTYFKNLSELAINDKISVTTPYGVFVYRVYKTGAQERHNSFDADEDSILVLHTDEYTGITTGKKSSKHIYVYASLISGPTVTE